MEFFQLCKNILSSPLISDSANVSLVIELIYRELVNVRDKPSWLIENGDGQSVDSCL